MALHEAFAHLKVVRHSVAAKALMDKAGIVPDAGIAAVAGHDGRAFRNTAANGRIWARETSVRTVF